MREDSYQPKRLVRRREAIERLGVGRTFLDEVVIKGGLLKFFKIGERATACLESDLNNLIDRMATGQIEFPRDERRRKVRYGRAPDNAA